MAEQSTFNFVVWGLLLIFISYWIACLCFIPYIIVSVIQACIPDIKPLSEMLMKGISFPAICSENMINRRGFGCQ